LVEAGLQTRLLNDYLVKMDRASMAHGLEVRSPFLDTSLAEHVLRLPNDVKFAAGRAKALLRNLAERHLGHKAASAPKRGFAVPVSHWLAGPLQELARDTIGSQAFRQRGLLRPKAVDGLLEQHVRGQHDHAHRLWSILVLEEWFRQFDGPRDSALPTRPGSMHSVRLAHSR
jgi:asparagine synthase (glutamine-hydrolysing)